MAQVFLLAAGEGRRLRPLTLERPKPLVPVAGYPMAERWCRYLALEGFHDCLFNAWYMADQMVSTLADGRQWHNRVQVLVEPQRLGTGGALRHAKPYLDSESFLVISADIWFEFSPGLLNLWYRAFEQSEDWAQIVLVPKKRGEKGDYALTAPILQVQPLKISQKRSVQYAGIAFLKKVILDQPIAEQAWGIDELFRFCIEKQVLTGRCWLGKHWDMGTPEGLAALEAYFLEHQGSCDKR